MEIKELNGYLKIGFLLNFSVVTLSKFSPQNCIKREQIGSEKRRILGSYFQF